MCPTRWTASKGRFHAKFIHNYSVLQELWDEAVTVVHDSEVTARIRACSCPDALYEFFLGLVLGESLLRSPDNLSRTLQKKKFLAAEGQ